MPDKINHLTNIKAKKMDLEKIKKHWDGLSEVYAKDLKSTTKTPTIKKLEITAIAQSIKTLQKTDKIATVLEVGCGNGYNLIGLTSQFPAINFTGIDFSEGMIKNANKLKADLQLDNNSYYEGNILKLDENKNLEDAYDMVFTNRCIINLNTLELQLEALSNLKNKVRDHGYIVLVENSTKTHGNQNDCRQALGLEKRIPDGYNLFIDEEKFLDYAKGDLNLELIDTLDFGSLHDMMLYVLIPKINGGKTDYAHPLMDAVTELLLNIDPSKMGSFGDFGQNRLYLFKK